MPRAPKEPEYECTDCDVKFGRKYEYDRHMMLHAPNREELEHQCPVGVCKYRALQKSNLKNHIQTVHEKRRNYKCTACVAAFGDNSARNRHEKRVHGITAQERKNNRNQMLGASRKATKTKGTSAEEALLAPEFNLASTSASSPATSSTFSGLGSTVPTPILGGNYAHLGTPLASSPAASFSSSSSPESALFTPILGGGFAYFGTLPINDESVLNDGQGHGLRLDLGDYQVPAARAAEMKQEEFLILDAYRSRQAQAQDASYGASRLWQHTQTNAYSTVSLENARHAALSSVHLDRYSPGFTTSPLGLQAHCVPTVAGNTNAYSDFTNSVPNQFSHNVPYTSNSDASANAYGKHHGASSSSTTLPVQMCATPSPYQQGQMWSSLSNWNGAFD